MYYFRVKFTFPLPIYLSLYLTYYTNISLKFRLLRKQMLRCESNYYYYRHSALGPVWAETRAQSGDWYGSGTLHPRQILRGSLPLLSPSECTIPY
jgi:hypothetical protein